MERRVLGRTGLRVSALGLGGGAVGGLMVRGSAADQERAVGLAVDRGVNFIDTAPSYGDGASETNLGRVLAALRPDVVLATKFTILPGDLGKVADAVAKSLESSLRRLQRERVDVLQLHNAIGEGGDRALHPRVVLEEVVPALEQAREAGKIGFFGITGVGDRGAVDAVVDSEAFDTAQVAFNLLNPSPARPLPDGFPAEDFGGLLGRAAKSEMGTIGIRALAGGALTGTEWRHPIGAEVVGPIGTGADYQTDVARGMAFGALVRGGWADSIAEAAMRFAVGETGLSTALVGVSTIEQLEAAIQAAERGPLPADALAEVERIWDHFAAEAQDGASR